MAKRERLEIIKDILTKCRIPTGITGIVYSCNLNFSIVKKYLGWCFDNGWLEYSGRFYSTTTVGTAYLNMIVPTINTLELLV